MTVVDASAVVDLLIPRDNLSAADSLYAALALWAGRPLLTSDLRLARVAEAAGIEVRVP